MQLSSVDWVWVALAMGLLFAVVYMFARSQSPAAPQRPSLPTEEDHDRARSSTKLIVVETESSESVDSDPPKILPRLSFEDEEVDPTKIGATAAASGALTDVEVPAHPIVYDEEAAVDEKTHGGALILVTGTAQTDKGLRRQRNEDAILVMPDNGLYAVADGMGGHRGGDIASGLAVKALESAFREAQFAGKEHNGLPRRASELARAIQMANVAILKRVATERELAGMGTTICAARFSSNKQRLYVGHVGDSRMYRLRDGRLTQLTADHTMGDLGVVGEAAAHLSRVVGVWPTVPVDIVLCKPRPRDIYLLCSDGLTKMLTDKQIAEILKPTIPPPTIVEALITAANKEGGRDNISAIVMRVDDAATSGAAA